jgi:hypothetical protein
MKITADGFIWKVIPQNEAETLYGLTDVYRLYEDDSESLVEWVTEITSEGVYALEVGHMTMKDIVKILKHKEL